MKVGIVGLPNAGKSSLFNILTNAGAQVGLYPFTTTDKNVGIVPVPDEKLDQLVKITKPQKVTPASIQFYDIAGLVKGASKGEGLGNKFLSHIREVNLILHLVRAFKDPNVPHVYSTSDPRRDYEIVEYELILADLEVIDKRLDKIKKKSEAKEEIALIDRIKDSLNRGHKMKIGDLPDWFLPDLPLLTVKPEIVILNFGTEGVEAMNLEGYPLSVRVEEEINTFSREERRELRISLGLHPDGLEGLIQVCFDTLKLIRFYTIKGDETRAWAIERGTKAIEAAGKIHTALMEGFIKAEVVQVDDLIDAGDFTSAVKRGKARVEGREYEIKDGDVLLVKFR